MILNCLNTHPGSNSDITVIANPCIHLNTDSRPSEKFSHHLHHLFFLLHTKAKGDKSLIHSPRQRNAASCSERCSEASSHSSAKALLRLVSGSRAFKVTEVECR